MNLCLLENPEPFSQAASLYLVVLCFKLNISGLVGLSSERLCDCRQTCSFLWGFSALLSVVCCGIWTGSRDFGSVRRAEVHTPDLVRFHLFGRETWQLLLFEYKDTSISEGFEAHRRTGWTHVALRAEIFIWALARMENWTSISWILIREFVNVWKSAALRLI